MKVLENYIADINSMARFFVNAKTYDLVNLNDADRRELLKRVENELSPENLSCDGELRGSKLAAKASRLRNVKQALEAL